MNSLELKLTPKQSININLIGRNIEKHFQGNMQMPITWCAHHLKHGFKKIEYGERYCSIGRMIDCPYRSNDIIEVREQDNYWRYYYGCNKVR